MSIVRGGYVELARRGRPRRADPRTYSLDNVRAAFNELEAGHMAGKILLIP